MRKSISVCGLMRTPWSELTEETDHAFSVPSAAAERAKNATGANALPKSGYRNDGRCAAAFSPRRREALLNGFAAPPARSVCFEKIHCKR